MVFIYFFRTLIIVYVKNMFADELMIEAECGDAEEVIWGILKHMGSYA